MHKPIANLAVHPNPRQDLLTLNPVPRLSVLNLTEHLTWNSDMRLLNLGNDRYFTLRHACAGVIVFGESGSGKTSGAGQTLALTYLKAGFGGLILCVKPDESATWIKYAHLVGRGQDVIRITPTPDCPYRYDFLAHEMTLSGNSTLATVTMIHEVTAVLRRGTNGGTNEEFWVANSNNLLKNTIDLYKLAVIEGRRLKDQGHLSPDEWVPPYKPTILTILELITSAAQKTEDFDSDVATENSLNLRCLRLAAKVAAFHSRSNSRHSEDLVHIFKLTYNFWRNEWAKDDLSDSKLRDNISAFAKSTMEPLERGEIANLFQRIKQVDAITKNEEWVDTVTPDMVDDGKIIIVDVPVKVWKEAGKLAGSIWKYVTQRFLERRADRTRAQIETVTREFQTQIDKVAHQFTEAKSALNLSSILSGLFFRERRIRRKALLELAQLQAAQKAHETHVEEAVRPVFIWADEYHEFTVKRDAEYQSTARSGRGLTVCLTQTTASLDDVVGRDTRESLVSNLTNKIYCKSKHAATNQWASETIGTDYRVVETMGESYGTPFSIVPSKSCSRSKQSLPIVAPVEFTLLRIGGPLNDFKVDAIIVGTDRFGPRTTWLCLAFDQNVGQIGAAVSQLKAKTAHYL